jgi:hypothetical protein
MTAQRRTRFPDIPAYAICADSARTIAGTLKTLESRNILGGRGLEMGFPAFFAACILLFDIWERRDVGGDVHVRNFDDVEKCMAALHMFEDK